jgi:probable addiction module antidote protein
MPRTAASKVAKTRATPYDVAEHLRAPEEMAAYLDAWLEEAPDDAAGIAKALGDIARAKGMSQVAKDAGLSRESLYRALSADGNPSFATVLKVARALGVKFHAEAA